MACKNPKIVRLHPSLYEVLSQERQRMMRETGVKISWSQAQQKISVEYTRFKFKLRKGDDEAFFRV
jgi:hypothetical protein